MSRQVHTTNGQVSAVRFSPQRFVEALNGTTSEAFARRIDRTLRTVQRWRAGESQPSGADLVLIAMTLERDPAWFYEHAEEDAA